MGTLASGDVDFGAMAWMANRADVERSGAGSGGQGPVLLGISRVVIRP